MWRSWVDRINSTPNEPHNDSLKPAVAPEELKRREQAQARLRDQWGQCIDLLSTDEERSAMLKGTFLPQFCDHYEAEHNRHTFEFLQDPRTLIPVLKEQLIKGIRSVSSGKTKSETSQALMDNLRSKLHLYHVIRAIRIVANGPDSLTKLLPQQYIPSEIVKLFRSFIDIPVEYYDESNNALDEADNLSDSEDNEMASIEDVGTIVTDTLTRFVQDQFVLPHLIYGDSILSVIHMISAKPEEGNNDRSIDSEPKCNFWKNKARTVLKSVPMTIMVSEYLHSKRSMDELVQCLGAPLTIGHANSIDYLGIIHNVDLIIHLVKSSVAIEYFGLYDELNEGGFYEIISTTLTTGPFNESEMNFKIELVKKIVSLVFEGKFLMPPSFEGMPNQHDDFVMPALDGPPDQKVQNIRAFQCLLNCLVRSNSRTQPATKRKKDTQCPIALQVTLFEELRDIIYKHPINYFIVERIDTVLLLIENMEYFTPEIQNGIMDILCYIMDNLNFVPIKELAVMSLHLQSSSSSGQMIALICKRFTTLLCKSKKYLTVVRETGLLNVMSSLLSDMANKLKSQAPTQTAIEGEYSTFIQHALNHFDAAIDCIIEMLQDTDNAAIFRKTYRANLFDLLHYPQTCLGVLRLFESICNQCDEPATNTAEALADIGFAFSKVIEVIQSIRRDDIEFRSQLLKCMKRILVAHPPTRDVFRKVGGYVCLVSMIVALEDAFINTPTTPDEKEWREKVTSILQMVFSVIFESTKGSEANRQSFSKDVGFEALENALSLTGALDATGIPRHVFGMLFAFALEQDSFFDLFLYNKTDGETDRQQYFKSRLSGIHNAVMNPGVIPCILNILGMVQYDTELSREVLSALLDLVTASRRNQVKMNGCGMLLSVLQRLFQDDHQQELVQRELLQQIATKLLAMGASYEELRYIFQRFGKDGTMHDLEEPHLKSLMDLVLQGASRSRWPNFIQFDSSIGEESSLQIPSLQNFPPSSPGYTILMWFHIEHLSSTSSLTLLAMWDDDKLAFQARVDAETGKLYIHSTGKQVAKFDSFEFQPGYWYHLSLVHSKSRLGASMSTMTMYVNGIWMEQIRQPYIAQPTSAKGFRCVLGTPSEFRPEYSSFIWDLGPCYLIQETLEAELVNMIFNLGARYKSLFQDTLRQFHTYEASTALFLNLRSISKTAGRKEMNNNTLVNIMRGNSVPSIAEHKIVLALFACNALSQGTSTGLTKVGLSEAVQRVLSKEAGVFNLVLNSAVPKLNVAMLSLNRMGTLVGAPMMAYPFGLDESIWKIGGCAVALKLVEQSETSTTLCKTVAILFEVIRYSWRSSEDMERCHGYEILAYLLKLKRDLITVELLDLLLVFIGKDTNYPEDSVINNPFAYRYVVLNFEIWKKTNRDVQKLQLSQFILFLQTSKKRQFNMKRLQKIHLVKKMLLAFRMNIYPKDLIPHAVEALKAVMLSSWNTENIRAVATFLASTMMKETRSNDQCSSPASYRPRSASKADSVSSPAVNASEYDSSPEATMVIDARGYSNTTKTVQMRNIVLEVLHDILCNSENDEHVKKFAATITNKWLLLFFVPDTNPYTVVLVARILTRVLVSQGLVYVNKFRAASDGFLVLAELLPKYWNLVQLYEALVMLMLGLDISNLPLSIIPSSESDDTARSSNMDITANLRTCLSQPSKLIIPEVMHIIVSMWQEDVTSTAIQKAKYNLLAERRGARNNNMSTSATREGLGSSSDSRPIRVQEMLIGFLSELYAARIDFREACSRQEIVDDMVEILFPSVCGSGYLTLEEEIEAKENTSVEADHHFAEDSVEDMSNTASDDSMSMDPATSIIRRGGASALMTKTSPHANKKSAAMLTRLRSTSSSSVTATTHISAVPDLTLEAILEFLVNMCVQSIVDPIYKQLSVLSMTLMSYPPSTHQSQMKFESFILTHIAQNLKNAIQCELELLLDTKVVTNVARFCQVVADAVLQGRFMNGAEQTYDLLATILEKLHSPEVSSRYGANDQAVISLYRTFNRMVLLKISDLEQGDLTKEQLTTFLSLCIHHQKIILSAKNTDMEFLRCFCYHLYQFLLSSDPIIKQDAASIWRLLILQKPDDISIILSNRTKENDDLIDGFRQMLGMDARPFFAWLDSRKVDLNLLFKEHIYKSWETIIVQENKYSRETLKNHQVRRVNKLKRLQKKRVYEQGAFEDYSAKTLSWSKNIHDVELGRFSKALQDNDGHENFIYSEWKRLSDELARERALWGSEKSDSKWRLDYTEGRHRMRKKIQCIANPPSSAYLPKQPETPSIKEKRGPAVIGRSVPSKNGIHLDNKTESEIDQELSQGPDYRGVQDSLATLPSEKEDAEDAEDDTAAAATANNAEEQQTMDDEDEEPTYEEDKNRKVLRLLDHGDMVIDVYNISQIAGLDACEGLLLLCKNNIYLIDNFFQRADGEVVEIWDVPKEERDQYLLLLAQAAGIDTDSSMEVAGDRHTCRKWASADLREVYKRRFLFRDVALELFFADGQNALLTVEREERDDLYLKLMNRVSTHESSTESIFGVSDKESLSAILGIKLSIFASSTLNDLAQKWQRRDITNFQYLMYLNAIAGRSYNDLTQYPVFPWILADYTSDKLDLENPTTFRDLSKPMGAQNRERCAEFADRYRQWGETEDPAPAFHYGTHYSSAMIVCSFLIRLEPFTQHFLKLQGGTFDHADRLFDSVGKAWESASEKNMGDVRELIPEFFYLPEFLENVNKFNFGVKQNTGESIDSVVLPPWAHGDPKIFIQRHREALESEYVSTHLHHWIDLIFGHKQQGQSAIDAMNVFHHVSYEGAVDLDSITDIVEKTATIGIINNFGQTPRQLFKKPHPARAPSSSDPLLHGYSPYEDHLDKLVQSIMPLRDIHQQVTDIGVYNDRLGVTACQQLFLLPDASRYIEWGYTDNSLRLFSTENGKLLRVFENMHVGYVSTACFPDTRTMVTGGTDNVICMWKIKQEKLVDFTLMECLRGHTSTVTSITASRSFSILVSGSEDKTAIVWDLNRRKYVRSLVGHESSVHLTRINDSTGDIITCSGHVIRVWTINGDLYLTKLACPSSESILSCAVYEGKPNEWRSQDLIATGHRRGIVKIWVKQVVQDNKTGRHYWSLTLKHQIEHRNRTDDSPDLTDIVSLSFTRSKRTLLSGNRDGKVFSFVLPDSTDTIHFQKEDKCKECMTCGKAYSVLERKAHCRTCGGVFCSLCIANSLLSVPDRSARFCKTCHDFLAPRISEQ